MMEAWHLLKDVVLTSHDCNEHFGRIGSRGSLDDNDLEKWNNPLRRIVEAVMGKLGEENSA